MSRFAMIKGNDPWLRVAHDNTTLDQQNECVQLAWHVPHAAEGMAFEERKAGLAVDPWCRVYRSLPESRTVTRSLWKDRLIPHQATPLFSPESTDFGDFQGQSQPAPLFAPGPIAIDAEGNLYLADLASKQVHIFALSEGKKRRTLLFAHQVCDLAVHQGQAYVLTFNQALKQGQLFKVSATTTPNLLMLKLPEGETINVPDGLAITPQGRMFILFNGRSRDAFVWAVDGENDRIQVPYAGDLLCATDDELVVARGPGQDFLRFFIKPGNHAVMPPLQARLYDGRGITLGPEGQVIYASDKGILVAVQQRPKYLTQGRLICFRLDNQQLQRRWGRVFIDACLPEGTELKLGFIVADELSEGPVVNLSPPANLAEFDLPRPDLSPPLPPVHAVNGVKVDFVVHRRSQNRELPWSFTTEPWRTYEAPVNAPPGRYLWLVIDLFGKSSASPKISQVRVEYPARDLLRHLPRVFSQATHTSGFLQRYLDLLNSNFDELEQRASHRQVLLDPLATPAAALPWLSGLLGINLDWRWSESAKRQIIKEAMWLFKFRGTVKGLKRFMEIYLEREVHIIEHYRTRGLGGAFVGDNQDLSSSAILGAGFRIGGKLDDTEPLLLDSDQGNEPVSLTDAITDNAHKFTVLIPLILNSEQHAVLEHILNLHRPAHTQYEICAVDSGMRVGTGLHLGLTSIVGLGADFAQLQLGNSVLGRSDLLGRAPAGMSVDNSLLGKNSRVG